MMGINFDIHINMLCSHLITLEIKLITRINFHDNKVPEVFYRVMQRGLILFESVEQYIR